MQSKPASVHYRKIVRIAGTLISTALFVLLISRQKWDVVLEKSAGIALWAILLSLLFYLLSFGFNTLRWCILLWAQDVRISLWQAYRLTWAGNFASNFLPSTIGGDGFRMLAVHPYTKKKVISIGSVVLDRIINMAAMACLIPAPLIIFGTTVAPQKPVSTSRIFDFGIWDLGLKVKTIFQTTKAGVYLGTTKAGVYLGTTKAGVYLDQFTNLPILHGLQKLFSAYFPKILAAFTPWSSKPLTFVYAFLVAWPSNLINMAATYLLAHQLGMTVSFWQVMGVQTVTYFLSVLPISVNGYGLREVAYTTLYASLGASVEQASTLALITRLLTVLATVPGAIWLSSVTPAASLMNTDE